MIMCQTIPYNYDNESEDRIRPEDGLLEAVFFKELTTNSKTHSHFIEPPKLHCIQNRLFLLLNASKQYRKSQYSTLQQKNSVDLWNHIQNCKSSSCKRKRCLSSRCLINHFGRCVTSNQSPKCKLCGPVFKRILVNEQCNKSDLINNQWMDQSMTNQSKRNLDPPSQEEMQNAKSKEVEKDLSKPSTLQHLQSRLFHLYDASTKYQDSEKLNPKQKYCVELWNHINCCKVIDCKRKHCLSSRCIVDHFNRCVKSNRYSTCKLCGPVMKRILSNKQHDTNRSKKRRMDQVEHPREQQEKRTRTSEEARTSPNTPSCTQRRNDTHIRWETSVKVGRDVDGCSLQRVRQENDAKCSLGSFTQQRENPLDEGKKRIADVSSHTNHVAVSFSASLGPIKKRMLV